MGKFMYPLPEVPTFPVYGLGPGFEGDRLLVMWNDQQQLYTVTLGHGEFGSESWVSVSTIAKPPDHVGDDDAHALTGFTDAVFEVVFGMAAVTHPSRQQAQREFADDELKLVGSTMSVAELGPEWRHGLASVAGREHNARLRRTDAAWAVLVDLAGVAIGVTGSGECPKEPVAIVDVRGRLDDYV